VGFVRRACFLKVHRLLQISVGWKQIMDLISHYHPSAAMMIRWSPHSDAFAGWKMILQSIANPNDITTGSIGSPTKAWAESITANFTAGLRQLDQAYPGKIAGVQFDDEWILLTTAS
jgi:hypothetical protein